MNEPQTIRIDDVEYVRKDSVQQAPKMTGNYYIVRTTSAGVFAGFIESRNGMEVMMRNARRIWYWVGAASLSQLAMSGTSNPKGCKFPEIVDKVILTQAIEIIECSDAGRASIESVPVWKA